MTIIQRGHFVASTPGMSATLPQVWFSVAHEYLPFLISSPEHSPGGTSSVCFFPYTEVGRLHVLLYFNNPRSSLWKWHFGQSSLSWIAWDVYLWPPQLICSPLIQVHQALDTLQMGSCGILIFNLKSAQHSKELLGNLFTLEAALRAVQELELLFWSSVS